MSGGVLPARGARVLSAGSTQPSYFLITGAESARIRSCEFGSARLACPPR